MAWAWEIQYKLPQEITISEEVPTTLLHRKPLASYIPTYHTILIQHYSGFHIRTIYITGNDGLKYGIFREVLNIALRNNGSEQWGIAARNC